MASGAVWASDDVLRPVMIDRSGRQIDQFLARRSYPGLTDLVREAYDGIGVGDVKATAEERHSERRVQVLQEGRSNFRNSVAIGVSKQRYAIGAGQAGSSPIHHRPHSQTAKAFPPPGGLVGFGDQHVAIG